MDQHVLFLLVRLLDELDHPVEQTLDVFVLRVFEEERQIVDLSVLKPILAVVPGTVHHMPDVMSFERLITPGNLLARNIQSLNDLTALLLALFPLASSLFRPIGEGDVLDGVH